MKVKLTSYYGNLKPVIMKVTDRQYDRLYVSYDRAVKLQKTCAGDFYPAIQIVPPVYAINDTGYAYVVNNNRFMEII